MQGINSQASQPLSMLSNPEREEKIKDIIQRRFGFPEKPLQFIGLPLPEWAEKYATLDRGLFVHGPVGCGKTVLMAQICKRWADKRLESGLPVSKLTDGDRQYKYRWDRDTVPWRFVNYSGFIMDVQSAFKKEKVDPKEMLDEVADAPIVVIDDLGAEKMTDYVRQATYYIMNARESNLRPTFITSNFSIAQLNEQIDPRVASRIAGMCDVVEMKGKDRRLTRDK